MQNAFLVIQHVELKGSAGSAKLLLALVLPLFILLSACNETPSEVVATVGGVEITLDDVLKRTALEATQGTDTLPQHTVVALLMNDAFAETIAADLGLIPSDEEVQRFGKQVEKKNNAPQLLQRVKEVFGEDTVSYNALFLRPKVIELKLQGYQRGDTAMQEEANKKIQSAYELVNDGKSFQEAAEDVGGLYLLDTFDITDESESSTPEQKHPLAALAEKHLQLGVVFHQVVQDAFAYRIVRLIDRNQKRSIVEMVAVAKESYADWFQRRAAKISMRISDQGLADSVKKHHGDIEWVEKNLQ